MKEYQKVYEQKEKSLESKLAIVRCNNLYNKILEFKENSELADWSEERTIRQRYEYNECEQHIGKEDPCGKNYFKSCLIK